MFPIFLARLITARLPAAAATVNQLNVSLLKTKIIQPNVRYLTLNTINRFNEPKALFSSTIQPCLSSQTRSLTKFSLRKGKRKTVKAVIKRFKRLDWGGWIRTHSGRHKKMWKKSGALKRRLRQHIFVNATQSWLLDKMVTRYWRRPKHYIDDPYAPYHKRNEHPNTRVKPIK